MKYPSFCNNIIDVTKPPYCADPTGSADCTEAIRNAFDDAVRGYVDALEATKQRLFDLSDAFSRDAYIGRESGRVEDGFMTITLPEYAPEAYIIYFPAGEYLISDTVTYSVNISTLQRENYVCELCRNIHIVGEDAQSTVIRLKDNAIGFKTKKPVISFNIKAVPDDVSETTNCAQMNTVEDITVDVGADNPGAIGIFYVSSNCGRIENVRITGKSGYCGIYFIRGSEGCFRNIAVSGFNYGFDMAFTSPTVIENCDVSENRIAGIIANDTALICRKLIYGDIPALKLRTSICGRYCFDVSAPVTGETEGNYIYAPSSLMMRVSPPAIPAYSETECAFVDDFGAVGDGITDSTNAIRRAFESGKREILFGKGRYLITGKIQIPATVELIDFMWCDLAAGPMLLTGETDAAFEISETSEKTLFMAHLMTHEQFYGYFHFVKHAVTRDVVFRDFALIFCAHYFNTVGGSRVFLDNCFQTVSTYAQNLLLVRRGCRPVFCGMIPYEFHSQVVYACNLNPERADVNILNDASDVYIDGLKTEGPGTALRSVGGGRTQINLFQSAFWNTSLHNALIESTGSTVDACGGSISYFNSDKNSRIVTDIDGVRTELFDVSREISDVRRSIDIITNAE